MSGRPFSVRRSKTDDLLAVEEMMNLTDAVQTVEARFGKQTLTELMCVSCPFLAAGCRCMLAVCVRICVLIRAPCFLCFSPSFLILWFSFRLREI